MNPVWIYLFTAWLGGSLVLVLVIALVARFALAPLLYAAAQLRHGPQGGDRMAALERRCRRLERRLGTHPPRTESSIGRTS